jgi:hypothetical protein
VVAIKNESEKQIFSGLDRVLLERLTGELRSLLASMEWPGPGGG